MSDRPVRIHPRPQPMTLEDREAIESHSGSRMSRHLSVGRFRFTTRGPGGRWSVAIPLGRRIDITAGRTGVEPRLGLRLSRRYDYRCRTDTDRCSCGKWLELRGWRDWTMRPWLYCPRCRYREMPAAMLGGYRELNRILDDQREPPA